MGREGERGKRVAICTVDTRGAKPGRHQGTLVKAHGGSLGRFDILQWEVYPVSPRNENTAYQEFQAE